MDVICKQVEKKMNECSAYKTHSEETYISGQAFEDENLYEELQGTAYYDSELQIHPSTLYCVYM